MTAQTYMTSSASWHMRRKVGDDTTSDRGAEGGMTVHIIQRAPEAKLFTPLPRISSDMRERETPSFSSESQLCSKNLSSAVSKSRNIRQVLQGCSMCIESSPAIWTPPRWLLQQIFVSSFAPQHFRLGVQSPIICQNKIVSSSQALVAGMKQTLRKPIHHARRGYMQKYKPIRSDALTVTPTKRLQDEAPPLLS
jgi:hypothetical protein